MKDVKDLPTHVDWRETPNVVSAVKDQVGEAKRGVCLFLAFSLSFSFSVCLFLRVSVRLCLCVFLSFCQTASLSDCLFV